MKLNNTDLLDILACPRCKGSLTLLTEGENHVGLACDACALVYPIEEGIPIMLVEEALTKAQWQQGMRKAK
jgi:uncharacterized protein